MRIFCRDWGKLQSVGIQHAFQKIKKNVRKLELSLKEVWDAELFIVYCITALTSLSDSISYIAFRSS